MYPELVVVWPDGTWNIETSSRENATYDGIAREIILDSWAQENFLKAEELAGYALNPGMVGTYPPQIPGGWKPSEKMIKLLFAKKNWEVSKMHYMIGQLDHLKKLRP
ncbi:MAG TPA: hypothetical protein VGV37_19755 [Aliidongia sp.]|uniref:hypothetical protein n=1 Tax=Aliidongia sp. TaxID=1914230 RepID=UPI002DDD28B8|nr:hypothetical protein [Aliidongia sp.]HEV2676771.1 hypothetical protein [Aliidongia sp.]